MAGVTQEAVFPGREAERHLGSGQGILLGNHPLLRPVETAKRKKKRGRKVRGRKKGKPQVIETPSFWLTAAWEETPQALGASGQQHQTIFIQENQ